jgi:hypothetical protein
MAEFKYDTGPFEFIPHLSIIDVLMWNSPETVRNAIKMCASIERVPSVEQSSPMTIS